MFAVRFGRLAVADKIIDILRLGDQIGERAVELGMVAQIDLFFRVLQHQFIDGSALFHFIADDAVFHDAGRREKAFVRINGSNERFGVFSGKRKGIRLDEPSRAVSPDALFRKNVRNDQTRRKHGQVHGRIEQVCDQAGRRGLVHDKCISRFDQADVLFWYLSSTANP